MLFLILLSCWLQISEAIYTRGLECFTPSVTNGWVEPDHNIWGNNFVGKFRCNPGFVLTGSETVKCRNGVWTTRPQDFPVCAAIGSCDEGKVPRISKNGFQQRKSHSVGTIFKYKCNKGYRLVGSTTAYCTPTGWSVGEAPTCARPGCDARQLLGDGVEYGASQAMYGGAVYRFSCQPDSVMVGSSVVVCDGEVWNTTKPACLAAPHPPSLAVIVDSLQVDSPAVSVGEEVTLVCHGLGGNPAPTVALYVNGRRVGEEGLLSSVYTFLARQHHDGARISCGAWNTFHQDPVYSLYQVLTIKYAPPATFIKGKTSADPGEHVQYTCTSAVSDPASDISIKVTDQDGDDIEAAVKKMPAMRSRKGFTSRISFEIEFDDTIDHVDIECMAENDVGKAVSTYRTVVTYPSTTTSHMNVKHTTIADFGESKDPRKPLSKTVLKEETKTKEIELKTKSKTIKENEMVKANEKKKIVENIEESISTSNKDETLIKISNDNKEETHHTTKDNKNNVENPDEHDIENKEVNSIELEESKHENLVQFKDDNDDYTSSYEDRSSENHDYYNSEYEETSSEQFDDYSSDYLEKSDHYTYDDMENIEGNYDDYISEKSSERNLDSQIDAVGDSDATIMNWSDESQNSEDTGSFVQLTNDYIDSSDENSDEKNAFIQLTNDYADSSDEIEDDKGTFVQLTNDYEKSSYDSDTFESADATETGRKDSNLLDYFKEEAVDEPVFLQSESESSNMALKSSMNIENAAQVSEMVFPVSSGRQLTVEFFKLLLLICLLNVTFFTNFRLII